LEDKMQASGKLVNAVIALVEERAADAREMMRSPEMRVSSSELQIRLAKALQTREDTAITKTLKSILRVSLTADAQYTAKKLGFTWDSDNEEAFLQGVVWVETIVENYLNEFKP
jgi:hypothetical protein